jgi:hypothetical protein
MSCYYYKIINETKEPVLKNVDVVLILTMEGSNRFKEDPFLLSLTKKTIIQYNKGYKNCKKPDTIISSIEDIVHAYYTAFEYLKEYNNVIILEDDALVINKDLIVYEKIDNFIKNENFNIFSFGSIGLFSKYNNDFYKISSLWGGVQANIFSKESRKLLINDIIETNFSLGTIDATYMYKLNNIYTYKYPLIIQLFPETENMANWSPYLLLLFKKIFIKILKLDISPNSWYFLYFLSKNYILILISLLILFLIILYFINKNIVQMNL